MLLEDLAPAVIGDLAAVCSPEQAELAIREVTRFHAYWWQDPKLEQPVWLRRSRDPADYRHSMLLILAAMVLNIGNGILTGEKMLRLMAENLVPRIFSAILELESGALLPTQPMYYGSGYHAHRQ